MKNFLKNNKGFSLLEVLIYIASLVLVMFIVINTTLMMLGSYAVIKVNQKIDQNASAVLERVGFELKQSLGLAVSGNIFNNDAGSLVLRTIDESENVVEKRFWLDGTNLKMQESGGDILTINSPDVQVNRFFLNTATSPVSKLVKIELEISAKDKDYVKTRTFYTSIVMRESY